MKKTIILLLTISATLFACNSSSSGNGKTQTIETVSVSEFAELMKGEGQLLDVRTPKENSQGNINGSMLLNVNDSNFKESVNKLDKTKPVYVYCRSGKRSMNAARIMKAEGFTKIYNLDGGFNAWSSSH